jgi:hypothetical protein
MEKQQINTEEQDIRENSSGSHFCEITHERLLLDDKGPGKPRFDTKVNYR